MTDNRATQAGALAGVKTTTPTSRVTQTGLLVGATIAPPSRVTQAGVLVGAILSPPSRVTQFGALVGEKTTTPVTRVTQLGVLVGVQTDTPSCLTREADCWKITRADGVKLCFTSHDRDMTFKGDVYHTCGSLTASALQISAGMGDTDNVDLTGLVTSNYISATDLWAGVYADAEVEIWRVAWDGSGFARQVTAGRVGDLEMGDTTFKFEIVTASERLSQQAVLDIVTPACRYKLGDGRCGVNLTGFTSTGSVTDESLPNLRTMAQHRIFRDAFKVQAAEYWQLGKLTWTSGDNAGKTYDVRNFGSGQFVLEYPTQFPIKTGDAYTVVRGCAKDLTTCDTVFSNAINFGGFPFVRGTDDLQESPGAEIG